MFFLIFNYLQSIHSSRKEVLQIYAFLITYSLIILSIILYQLSINIKLTLNYLKKLKHK